VQYFRRSNYFKRGNVMEPDKIMENLFEELGSALKALSKVKTVEEKVSYSQVIKNLSESLGIFLELANPILDDDLED
jgi:hypothetical protein